jgi:hypothetical protein
LRITIKVKKVEQQKSFRCMTHYHLLFDFCEP